MFIGSFLTCTWWGEEQVNPAIKSKIVYIIIFQNLNLTKKDYAGLGTSDFWITLLGLPLILLAVSEAMWTL